MQTGGRRSKLFGIVSSLVLLINLNAVSAQENGGISTASSHSAPTINTFQYTGAAVSSLPILVPPGRNGIAPKLALTYNSYRKNGWVGVGWDLDMGAIKRSTKRGLDYRSDNYIAMNDGFSVELMRHPEWGEGYFGAKLEGQFTKYNLIDPASGGWIVTTKDGLTYFYGSTPESRQDDPADSSHVFKWCLDRIVDSNDNVIEIEYQKIDGQVYLERIHYTLDAKTGSSTGNLVKFYYEDRPDIQEKFDAHFKVITRKRLKTIDITSRSGRVRCYELKYSISGSTGRSILSSLRQLGNDAILDNDGSILGATELLPTDFSWQQDNSSMFTAVYAQGDPGYGIAGFDLKSSLDQVFPFDYNGDGLSDLFLYRPGGGAAYVAGSNGDGSFTNVYHSGSGIAGYDLRDNRDQVFPFDYNGDGLSDLFLYRPGGGAAYVAGSNGDGSFTNVYHSGSGIAGYDLRDNRDQVFPFDYNGDGLSDLFLYRPGSGAAYVARSNGDGSFTNVYHSGSGIAGYDLRDNRDQVFPFDYNGDGLSDLFLYRPGGGAAYVARSNGDGSFTAVYAEGAPGNGIAGYDLRNAADRAFSFDYNGDGLSDLFLYRPGRGAAWVARSNGDGSFTAAYAEGAPGNGIAGYDLRNVADRAFSFDYNGDGLSDLFLYRPGRGAAWVARSNGDGSFTAAYAEGAPGTGIAGYDLRNAADRAFSFDFNGNGKNDLFLYRPGRGAAFVAQAGNFEVPDILVNFYHPTGASTQIEYLPSSRYKNERLPFILQTVSKITVSDGNGVQSTNQFNYLGGYFDYLDRQFVGFETVTQTNPDGTILKTTYYQGDPIDPADNYFFQGRQKSVELREPNEGALLTKTDFTWETYPTSPPQDSWAFVKLTHKLTESYDSDTVSAQENYLYDDTNGNLESMTISGPEAESITTSFLYENYGDWLWRKIQEKVEGSISGMVRESYYDYEPGTGNLLYKEFWLDTGPNPRITMTYDEYGNQQMVTDARGNTTITEYDSTTHTYPIKITYPQTNGVSHIVENEEWDYRFGKPTVTKDENGNRTYYHYDEFGRLDQVDAPDGGQVITEYHDDAFPRYVLAKAKEDSSGATIDAYEYFDGLGRSIQTISFGENGQPIVTKTRYDVMGRGDQTWGPFFSTFIGYHRVDEIPDNIPYAKTDYDLHGRPVRMEAPLGEDVDSASSAVTTLSYSGLSTTVTDPDGGKKTEIKDYLGRIIQVTEYSDAGELYTDYSYNAVGDLLDVTDAMGNVTAMSYDSLGRKISMTDPDMGYWQYSYDANGNLDTQTDAKGHRIKFRYDAINRVYQKEYLDTAESRVDYVYDLGINGIGRLYSVSNGEGTTVYDEYDPTGRKKSVTRQITGAPLSAYTTHYSYDYSGKVKSMIYPGTTPYQVNYDYHPGSGLLHTVTGISDFTEYAELTGYEPTGKIGDIYHGNGAETLYTYDAKSTRLLSIQTTDPNLADLLHKTYKYTPAGDIKTITRVNNAQSITYSYAYDKLHRLIAETNTGGSDAFDPSMLVKTYDDTAPIHAVKSVEFNGVDYPYLYDENGNMTMGWDYTDPSRPVKRQIDFNADNMPVQIRHMRSSGTVNIDLSYDGAGVRVKKAVQSGSTTYYIGDHYEVKDGVATKIIFAGNLRVANIVGTDINYYHKDHLGSSLVITDKNGNVIETAEYTPFGCLRNHAGATVSDYKFTDQEYDPSIGLYNYNARLYDPNIGSFISPDPFVQAPFDPQTLNRYTYVRNNPLIYIDPSGYGFFKKLWKKTKKVIKKATKAVVSAVTSKVLTHILLSPFDIAVPGLGQAIAIGIGYASSRFADYSVDKIWGSNGGGGGGSISSGAASSGSSGGGYSGRYFPSGVSPGGGYAAISGANHDFANAYSANVVSNGHVFHGAFYEAIGKIYSGVSKALTEGISAGAYSLKRSFYSEWLNNSTLRTGTLWGFNQSAKVAVGSIAASGVIAALVSNMANTPATIRGLSVMARNIIEPLIDGLGPLPPGSRLGFAYFLSDYYVIPWMSSGWDGPRY